MNKYLLIVTALCEAGVGLLLLFWPAVPQLLLLGVEQITPESACFGRIAGAALVAFAVACWAGRNVVDCPAAQGLLFGVLFYDLAAAAILAYSGGILELSGIALWPAVGLHVVLAVWCVWCIRKTSKVTGKPNVLAPSIDRGSSSPRSRTA